MFHRLMTAAAVLLVVAVAAAPAAAQVEGNGILKGRAYFDLSKGLSDSNENVMTYNFRRIYLTYDMTISDAVKGRFRTDVKQDTDGKVRLYIKHAYADWKVNEMFTLRTGLQGTILFGDIEEVWGYRSVAKTMQDHFKIRSSADFGVQGRFKFNDMVGVNVLMSNGEGYDKADDDANRKAYEVQGVLTPVEGLLVTGMFGLNGYDIDGDADTTNDQNDITTMDLSIGYTTGTLNVGGSFTSISNWDMTEDQKARGLSAFGRFGIPDSPITLLAKFDRFDPDTDVDDDQTTYIVAGVDYLAAKGFSLIPNIQQTKTGNADAETTFLLTFYWKW